MRQFPTTVGIHSPNTGKPNYTMVSAYSGTARFEDVVSSEPHAYGARRLKEKQPEASAQYVGTADQDVVLGYNNTIDVAKCTATGATNTGRGAARGKARPKRWRGPVTAS